MRKKLRWSCVALVALAALLGYGVLWNSAMSEDAKGRAEDVHAIKQAAADYSAALNKGDVDGLLAHWAPDADYIDESGKTTRGRAAIAALLRKNQEHLKGHKMKLEGTGLRFVTPDAALADGKATLVSPDGTEDVTPFTAVWVKSKGKWLVKSLRDFADDTANEPETATDHLSHLELLLGDWVSTDKGAEVQFHCRWTLNKSFLLAEYTVKRGDHETSTAQRFGWDPSTSRFIRGTSIRSGATGKPPATRRATAGSLKPPACSRMVELEQQPKVSTSSTKSRLSFSLEIAPWTAGHSPTLRCTSFAIQGRSEHHENHFLHRDRGSIFHST
jgi:uncharacterized protein (TIGR02246 family)